MCLSPAVPRSNLPHPRERPANAPSRPARAAARPCCWNEPPKEKVTLRLDAELVADYRDWSWDQRCQLGELVEQALRAFWTGRQVG